MKSYRKFIKYIAPWLALALIMNLVRFAMTDVHSYVYMNWNLLLAFIPLLALYLFERSYSKYLKVFLFFLWFLFLPNAPYIVTDLIHLRDVGPEWMLWFDGMMLFAYALVGVYVTAYSMIKMKNILFKKIIHQNIFLIIISLLSSFGIYLGRYIRWNTWDIITHPIDIALTISDILSIEYFNPLFITSILFFTLFILAGVISFEEFFKEKKEA